MDTLTPLITLLAQTQEVAALQPPKYPWLPTAVAVFLLICLILASIKSAKRTHQD